MKHLKFSILLATIVLIGLSLQGMAQGPSAKVKSKDWQPLLDENLSKWEVWTGVPQPTVKNLPAGYVVPADGKPVKPIGLGDPMKIYTVEKDENGEVMVHISGLVFAGLTSLESYSNYHLTLQFKWGEKKYAPRLEAKRDNGLLYHCHGEHGAFWDVWKSCLECQIQEGDFGDLFALAGTSTTTKLDSTKHWDPKATETSKTAKRAFDNESPHGEWTRVDLYVLGDKAVHVVNGKVVLALENALSKEGKKLDKGQIQIQSEAAEGYVKDVCIRPIKKFPKAISKAAGF